MTALFPTERIHRSGEGPTAHLDTPFPYNGMMEYDELSFKVVRLEPGGQEVIACAGNYEICKAAFEKALFVYPKEHLEMRQGARIILKSKES